jgi:hypothetical protein
MSCDLHYGCDNYQFVKNYSFKFAPLQKVLKEEVRIYRQHLYELVEEEKRRERELDAIVNEDMEKQCQKRADQWQREADARQSLLRDVLAIRKQQVQDKCKY